MCYCPTPTLHLNLALTGDGAFLLSPQKTHSVWFISILNYGDTENVLINHLLLVIPMSYPCHYTNLCPHKPHKHAHTHTHTHRCIHLHRPLDPWIAAWQFAAAESRFTVTEEHINPPEPSHTLAHRIPYKRNTLDSPKSHTHTYDHCSYSLTTQATGQSESWVKMERLHNRNSCKQYYVHSHQIYRWNYPFCQEQIFPDWVYVLAYLCVKLLPGVFLKIKYFL